MAMVILCGRSHVRVSAVATGNVFSTENAIYTKFINYRPFASPSFEVARHVKNCHFGQYYYYYDVDTDRLQYHLTVELIP